RRYQRGTRHYSEQVIPRSNAVSVFVHLPIERYQAKPSFAGIFGGVFGLGFQCSIPFCKDGSP
ncbi:MAG: hypothetical protein P8N43_13190, partial [Alphaproteobacteria bacterium]|nr:hypothetical protein [Alphaproteobacteria bacterium]